MHLGPEAKGVLLSAFFWSYTLMQIPMGVIADRVNLRWLYGVAFALWSLSQGLMGLAAGLGSLIAFRVLLGIGESIYLPGGSKIVSLLFRPHERGLPAGLFDAGTRTGLVMEGVLVPMMLVHLRLAADVHGRRVQRARLARTVVPADAEATCANRTRTPGRTQADSAARSWRS